MSHGGFYIVYLCMYPFTLLVYELFRLYNMYMCPCFSQILFNLVMLYEHGKARENQFFSSGGNFILNCNHYVQHVCSKCILFQIVKALNYLKETHGVMHRGT